MLGLDLGEVIPMIMARSQAGWLNHIWFHDFGRMRTFQVITILLLSLSACGASAENPGTAILTVYAGARLRAVPPLIFGHNLEWSWGGGGLFKQDGTGPVERLVPLIKALRPGLIRYPGGSQANVFRFVQSLGPLGQRQPVANFFAIKGHWTEKVEYQTEKPLPGFDDFMAFTRATEAAGAMVTINCTWWPHNAEISGTPQEAAAWVAYANAGVGAAPVSIGLDRRGINWRDSKYWANQRKQNGHPEPYNVKYWEIGNEVYDPSQGAGVSGAKYAVTATEFAQTMKSVDPSVRIGAVIACDQPGWNDAVIGAAGPALIDFLILHTYGPGETTESLASWRKGSRPQPLKKMQLLSSHAEMLDRCLTQIGRVIEAKGVPLPIQVTEFNALYGTLLTDLKESRDLKSALYSARHLQKFLENPMIVGANFWCLKSAWFMVVQNGPQGLRYAPAGLMFQAMSPLTQGDVVPYTWSAQPQFKLDRYPYQVPWVTAVAVRDRDQLAINLLSWHPTEPVKVQVSLKGPEIPGSEGKLLRVTGPGPDANNEEEQPASVTLQESHVRLSKVTTLELPPVSLSTLILKIK